jgi:hypothetical protein
MLLGIFSGEELASAFHYSADSMLSPWDFSWVSFGIESDLLSVDDEAVLPGFDAEGESKMGGVVLEKILEGGNGHHWVIDGAEGKAFVVFEGSSESESTNSSETVDTEHLLDL